METAHEGLKRLMPTAAMGGKAGTEIGLLFNFGAERLEFKRKTRTYRPKEDRQD